MMLTMQRGTVPSQCWTALLTLRPRPQSFAKAFGSKNRPNGGRDQVCHSDVWEPFARIRGFRVAATDRFVERRRASERRATTPPGKGRSSSDGDGVPAATDKTRSTRQENQALHQEQTPTRSDDLKEQSNLSFSSSRRRERSRCRPRSSSSRAARPSRRWTRRERLLRRSSRASS